MIKHLKETGHQPSPLAGKLTNSDIKTCYTCKAEFSSYWNLMTHRKERHPSNKRCRYFNQNNCKFGSDCWYVHDIVKQTPPSNTGVSSAPPNPKSSHDDSNQQSLHDSHIQSSQKPSYAFMTKSVDFQEANIHRVPPDQLAKVMDMMTSLTAKVQSMEESLSKMNK